MFGILWLSHIYGCLFAYICMYACVYSRIHVCTMRIHICTYRIMDRWKNNVSINLTSPCTHDLNFNLQIVFVTNDSDLSLCKLCISNLWHECVLSVGQGSKEMERNTHSNRERYEEWIWGNETEKCSIQRYWGREIWIAVSNSTRELFDIFMYSFTITLLYYYEAIR